MHDVKYLIKIDANENNNKFYKMIPKGDVFIAEWGRLGNDSFQSKQFPMSQFDKKYRDKVSKGYVDKSDLIADLVEEEKDKVDNSSPEYKPIPDEAVRLIVDRLQSMARKTIEANYKVSSMAVTQAMVDEAQKYIDKLVNVKTVKTFNDILVKLFATITRKMDVKAGVKAYLADSKDDFEKIIQREQDLLDVMAGQVKQHDIKKETDSKQDEGSSTSDLTILDAMGLEMRTVTAKEEKEIKKQLGKESHRYVRAWKVINKKTQKAFDDYLNKIGTDKEVKQLWHGSRNENWWSIITSGLVLRPTNVVISGKMFGYGIYFAPEAGKSVGYTSIQGSYWARGTASKGYMSLYDVIYGDPYIIDKNYYSYSGLGSLTYESLQKAKPGADSVHALAVKTGLARDEIIVYKSEQVTIKYLVEIE